MAVPNKPKTPKTMAELLPEISGLLTQDGLQMLTAKKQPPTNLGTTRTAEKVFKPMTMAEMSANMQALRVQSPKRNVQGATSTKKKWNSSVKVENKTVSHTAGGQMKHNSVRKVLNFQMPKPKVPKAIFNSRMTTNSETPKFQKNNPRTRKSIYPHAQNAVRISGVCHIAETPLLIYKPTKSRMSLANKENIPNQDVTKKKTIASPRFSLRKRIMLSRIPDTPLSNESWKSSCDDSFLQKEKDIEFDEDKIKILSEKRTQENIPPMSTPFKEYQNVNGFFNNSDVMDISTSAYQDDTIMCFDKTSVSKEKSQEESFILSLCDMLNKATVSKEDKTSTELVHLLEVEKQTVNHLKMIENGIKTLNCCKESQLKSLQYVRELIQEKQKEQTSESDKDKTVIESTKDMTKIQLVETPIKSPRETKPSSVLKSCMKSPSYKIPKKNVGSMRKKVCYRALPNVSDIALTPPKDMGDKALSIYMNMKKHMNFLRTPVVKQVPRNTPDTPAITSHNLQIQLDKLYDEH